MISKRSLVLASLIVCLFPSLSWGYIFDIDWRDYSSSNYGRAHLVAVNVFLAIAQEQGVTLSESSQTLLSGSFTGNLTATKDGHSIYLNYPYSNDGISKRVCLWPIQQDGNVFKCAYYMLIYGKISGSIIPGTENTRYGFIWSSLGECNITNIFAGDISVQILNHNNHFPAVVDSGAVSWMNPNVRDINLAYDSINTTLVSQRIRPGAVLENRSLFYDFGNLFYLTPYINGIRDFLSWNFYNFSSAPGPFSLIGTSSASSGGSQGFYSQLQTYDTDAGSEPDLHEFYTLHLYTYPEDDWTYSGEDYPSGGGGSGVAGEITGISSGAQGQLTSAGSEALRDYFGASSDLDQPVLDSTQYTSSPDEIQLDDYWLSDPLQKSSDLLPGGASTFRTLVDRLKVPDSSSLPRWTLNFEVNTGAIAGTIWQGVTYTIDFATLKNAYPAIFTTLRTLAVVCMFVSLIIYLIKDNFLLGGNPSAGSEDD